MFLKPNLVTTSYNIHHFLYKEKVQIVYQSFDPLLKSCTNMCTKDYIIVKIKPDFKMFDVKDPDGYCIKQSLKKHIEDIPEKIIKKIEKLKNICIYKNINGETCYILLTVDWITIANYYFNSLYKFAVKNIKTCIEDNTASSNFKNSFFEKSIQFLFNFIIKDLPDNHYKFILLYIYFKSIDIKYRLTSNVYDSKVFNILDLISDLVSDYNLYHRSFIRQEIDILYIGYDLKVLRDKIQKSTVKRKRQYV